MPSSYTLSTHLENFIKAQIESGRYANASEVIRAGLRMLEEHEEGRAVRAMGKAEKLEWLRAEIQKGIDSGPSIPAEEVFARGRAYVQQRQAEREAREAA